jgi:hypothetical protein
MEVAEPASMSRSTLDRTVTSASESAMSGEN